MSSSSHPILRHQPSSIHSCSSTVFTHTSRSDTYSSLLHQIRASTTIQPTHDHHLPISNHHGPLKKTVSSFIKSGISRSTILSYALLFVLLSKSLVGLGPYSGYRSPPLFGDLEAQRHWMALTLHINLKQWYHFDPGYWGLDYPPLTAYHSLLLGHLAKSIDPRFVLLRSPSKELDGWGDELHTRLKTFLRFTVLASEVLIWIPIVLIYHFKTFRSNKSSTTRQNHKPPRSQSRSLKSNHQILSDRRWLGAMYSILVVLLNPNLILIDNGHFQFNSIMLGLTLASVTCFCAGRDLLGAVMFVCSLAFKQMALYYAPAIFAYLLGKCLYLGHPKGTRLFRDLALITTGTMVVLFGPFIFTSDFPQSIIQVLQRIFPIGRGIFEDKVGNFWCTLNLIVKIRTFGTVKSLANIALLFTLSAVLPGILMVLITSWKLNPNRSTPSKLASVVAPTITIPSTVELLPFTLFNSAIGFYLFSFQVHEKSILLAVLPLLLILSSHHSNRKPDCPVKLQFDWNVICLISNISIFSMWPLLKREQLGIQYLVSVLSYNHMIGYNPLQLIERSRRNLATMAMMAIYVGMVGIHISEQMIEPPSHLPHLFVVMNHSLSFVVFAASYVWSLVRIYEKAWILNGFRATERRHDPIGLEDKHADDKSVVDYGRSECSFVGEEEGRAGEEEEEEEGPVRLPTKRSTSLQQPGRRGEAGTESESEGERAKWRSMGASTGQRVSKLANRMLQETRAGSRAGSKAIISSPSGEKLMHRIKNRLLLEAERANSRSRSRSSHRSSSLDPADPLPARPLSAPDPPPDPPAHPDRLPAHACQPARPSAADTLDQPLKTESAWEVALRQSREEAIRRRREELMITRNHKR